MSQPNRKRQPETTYIDRIDFFEPTVMHLANNIPVYCINTGTQDLIKVEIVFKAGGWHENKPLTSKFTLKMLKEGTKGFTSAEIADKLDFYGAHLKTSCDDDFASVTLYSLIKHFTSLLPVIEEAIKFPTFPETEFSILNQNKRNKFILKNQKVKFIAKTKFRELLFGNGNPYGKKVEIEDFDRISQDDLIDFHKVYYRGANCFIIISGKINDQILQLTDSCFGGHDWYQKGEFPEISYPVTISPGHSSFIEKEDAVQTAIRIGKVLFSKSHPDFLRLKILNTVLGGYFGSRLMTSLREENGYTYGIGSGIISKQKSGYFFIASEVGTDVTHDAIREIFRELEIITHQRIPEKELKLVKNYILGSFQRSLDGPFSIGDSVRALVEYELTNDYYRDFVELVKSVTSMELLDVAQRWLQPESLTVLTVGAKI